MIVAVVLALLIPILLVYFYKNAYKRPENFPPGPPSLPVYGGYWIVLAHGFSDLSVGFRKLGQKYKSKIIGLNLGPVPTIVVNDPDLIKEVLYREEFDGRMDVILFRLRSFWKKLGIFFTDGYFWHVQRRFSLRYLRDYGFGRRDSTLEAVITDDIKEMLDLGINGPKYPAEREIINGDLVFLPFFLTIPFMNGIIYVLSRSTLPRAEYKELWSIARGAIMFQRNSNDVGGALSLTPWLKDVLPNYSGYNSLRKGNQCLLDFFQCLFSPQLYKRYTPRDEQGPNTISEPYQPRLPEKCGQSVITAANYLLYTSPLFCMFMYKRGFFSYEEARIVGNLIGCIVCVLGLSFTMRAYGRVTNPKYVEFLRAWSFPKRNMDLYLKGIRRYDFDFNYWPVSYTVPRKQRSSWHHPFSMTSNPELPWYQRIPIQVLAFVAIHTFGLRITYPGSVMIAYIVLWKHIFQGRTHLVEKNGGQRAKVQTADGNKIDTLFVDNRSQKCYNGETLIICCEGNLGFYELGIMGTPVKAGYSALGWNHPGFAESTGYPYPAQERNAIEAVMLYAIEDLEFEPQQIVMFGWSIGGYTAAWAAANFPVQGLILDATFDDLLPLAEKTVPESWYYLVKEVVYTYVDLNVAALASQYHGPIQLIRRSADEVICTKPGVTATNRANFLMMKILKRRHPHVLMRPLAKACIVKILNIPQRFWISRPEAILVKLVSRYLRDVESSHCEPLSEHTFIEKLIKDNMGTHDDTYDRHFIDMYLTKMKGELNSKSTYSLDQLVLTCTDYMFPAASAVQFTLTILIERLLLQPGIQEKIHEEIDRVVGRDRLPDLDDRRNMPYVEACIREILRHETTVPLGVPHRTMTNTKIGGYDIPENTMVNTHLTMLHMNEDIWGDPQNFRPERFIKNGQLDLASDKSLPFGAGRRLCAGETYARQTMFQVFAAFMQAFTVSTADGKRLLKPSKRIQGIITTIPEFWVRITPRN